MNLLATRVPATGVSGESKRAARYIIAIGESQADDTAASAVAARNPLIGELKIMGSNADI